MSKFKYDVKLLLFIVWRKEIHQWDSYPKIRKNKLSMPVRNQHNIKSKTNIYVNEKTSLLHKNKKRSSAQHTD